MRICSWYTDRDPKRKDNWSDFIIIFLFFFSRVRDGGEERKGRARLKETIRRKFYCDRGFERVNEF